MADEPPAWLADLKAMIGNRGGGDDDDFDDDDDGGGRRSFRRRLDRLRSQRDGYRQERDAAKEMLAKVPERIAEIETAATKRIEDLQVESGKALTGAREEWADDLKLNDAGVTSVLARKAVRDAHAVLPKDQRGDGPVQWWESQVAAQTAHLADPKTAEAPTVPTHLAVFLPATAAPPPNGAGPGRLPPGAPNPPGANDLGSYLDAVPVEGGLDAFAAAIAAVDAQRHAGQ